MFEYIIRYFKKILWIITINSKLKDINKINLDKPFNFIALAFYQTTKIIILLTLQNELKFYQPHSS